MYSLSSRRDDIARRRHARLASDRCFRREGRGRARRYRPRCRRRRSAGARGAPRDCRCRRRTSMSLTSAMPLRIVELRLAVAAVAATGIAGAELAQDAAVVIAFENAVVAAVGNPQARRRRQHLAGKLQRHARLRAHGRHAGFVHAQIVRRRLRRAVGRPVRRPRRAGLRRPAAPANCPCASTIAKRRPRLHAVVAPQQIVRIVRDRMADMAAIDRLEHRRGLALVVVFRRVHADHAQAVVVLGFEITQVGQRIGAVDAVEGPEIQQHDAAAQAPPAKAADRR